MFCRHETEQKCSNSKIYLILGLVVYFFISGCSVSYIDESTGQLKVVGFVNLEIPIVVTKNSNVKVDVNSAGLLFYSTPHQNSLSFGYSQTSAIYMGNENDIFILDNNQTKPCKEAPQGELE